MFFWLTFWIAYEQVILTWKMRNENWLFCPSWVFCCAPQVASLLLFRTRVCDKKLNFEKKWESKLSTFKPILLDIDLAFERVIIPNDISYYFILLSGLSKHWEALYAYWEENTYWVDRGWVPLDKCSGIRRTRSEARWKMSGPNSFSSQEVSFLRTHWEETTEQRFSD